MSEMITAILTCLVVMFLCGIAVDDTNTKRVERLRFEHKGQIFMLVPAKLQPATTP